MRIFKHRLKQLVYALLAYLIVLAGIVVLLWIATFISQVVIYWIGGIIIGIFGLLLVGTFVNWLFIEPFKKEK